MEKLLRLVKSAWGRFLAGLTAALTLLWMTHPEYTGHIEWESTIAFVLAALAWAYSCLPDDEAVGLTQTSHAATDHDRKLFEAFNAQMPPAEVSFLRGHDFGGSFLTSRLDGLRGICVEWLGAAYEFDDPEVQGPFEFLLVKMRHLSSRRRACRCFRSSAAPVGVVPRLKASVIASTGFSCSTRSMMESRKALVLTAGGIIQPRRSERFSMRQFRQECSSAPARV